MSRRRSATALASMTNGILRWAAERGIPRSALIDPRDREGVERAAEGARIPLELHVAVWRGIELTLADPSFALRSAESILDVSSLGLVGLLAMTSSTVGDSLARSVKYSRVLKDDVVARMSVTDTELVIELWTSEPLARTIADASLFAFRHFAEKWSEEAVVPKAVFFRHPRPGDVAEYERFGCPVHFGHAVDAITFHRDVAAVPLVTAQPEVARYLEKTADLWIAQHLHDGGGLHGRLVEAIHRSLEEGRSEIDHVARRLATSPRTLQRALGAEGRSYRQVLDEVRWSIAAPLVSTTELPLEQIAERLGYADGKAFRRAFRRWAGVAPIALRRGGSRPEGAGPPDE